MLALVLATGACKMEPKLKLTEIGLREVEIYNAERKALSIEEISLEYASTDGTEASVVLFGELDGKAFLVVWEDADHEGAPVAAGYTNSANETVPGIKVAAGTFGTPGPNDGFAFALRGHRERVIHLIPVEKTFEDAVRFGSFDPGTDPPVERPLSGVGNFEDTGSLAGQVRTETLTIQRGWDGEELLDSNTEDDWSLAGENLGRRP